MSISNPERTTSIPIPTSRCRFGVGWCDITPPVGIYHRFWGAAKHDRATGVHRPLRATAVIFEPLEPRNTEDGHERRVLIALDHCLLRPRELETLSDATSRLTGIEREAITFTFSHTHSGGHIAMSRVEMPGGDLIPPYLDELPNKIAAAVAEAASNVAPVVFSYATAECPMGHDRDYWDAESNRYVCGFNPDAPVGLPVNVIRVTALDGRLVASVVNYPCHPTTLAWENSLISPDYVGALREVVEDSTGAPCLFLLGACGDLGPRHGYVGDTSVADSNGRQVAYAALGALESLPPPGTDFEYEGAVLSGATLGAWRPHAQSAEREAQTTIFRRRRWQIPLDYLSDLPRTNDVELELNDLMQRETMARRNGDEALAGECRALAERQRRVLERIAPLPDGPRYPFEVQVTQLGDAFWVAVEGEPYFALQRTLARRFIDNPIIVVTLAGGARPSYLPERSDYGKPLYQAEIAVLAPGCLERVTQELGAQIESWL